MSSFSKVKNGISGLKKQKYELEKNYDFLTQELHRVSDDNTAQIRTLVGKAEEFGADISGMREHLKKTDESIGTVSTTVGGEITGIQKRLDTQKKSLNMISQKLQQATDAATEAARGISDSRKFEKDVSKSLQDLSSGVSSVDEKVSTVDASSREAIGAVDKKFTAGMAMVKKLSETQTGVIKEHDSALERVMLTLQAMKKDILAENERIANVRTTAKSTEKKLELLATLETKVKHIDDVKMGLVKGIESIKSIENDMDTLKQKTRDLESRLSNADKFLESRLLEKTKTLDSQIADKTAVMESQMQERLKFLESNLTEKGRTLETKLSADLVAVNKSLARELADIKKLKAKLERSDSGINDLKSGAAGLKKASDDNKNELMLLWEKVNAYRDIAGRVAEIEQAKDTILGGIGRVDKLAEDVKLFRQKEKNFETKTNADITSLSVDRKRAFSDIAGMNLALAGIRMDSENAMKLIAGIKVDHDSTKKRIQAIETIKNRLNNSEKLIGTLGTKIEEIRSIDKKIAALSKDLKAVKASMDSADFMIDEKIKFNVDAIKKDNAFSSASLARLDEELRKLTLEITSMKKDLRSESAGTNKLQSAVSTLQNKATDLEKLQIKLGDMEQTKQALTDAMEAKLQERIKFIEAALIQKADSIEAGFAGDIGDIKKQLSSKDKSIEDIKRRLENVVRMSEKQKNAEKELGTLKTEVAAGLTELRGKLDTSKSEEGNKFSTAVKAFLNTKAELGKRMSILDLKISENEKRFDDFSKVVTRLDLIERKLDKLSDKGSQVRRDVDSLERRGSSDEKIMVVDLAKDKDEFEEV